MKALKTRMSKWPGGQTFSSICDWNIHIRPPLHYCNTTKRTEGNRPILTVTGDTGPLTHKKAHWRYLGKQNPYETLHRKAQSEFTETAL